MRATPLLDVAHALVRARHAVSTLAAPSSREGGLTLSEAYAVAAEVAGEWSSTGHMADGIKIGFAARSKWDLLGITGPFWGQTYTSTTREAGGEPFDLSGCVAPRLEAEIVVGLAQALEPGVTVDEVAQAVAWAALGFELVDCHVADWAITAPDLVADFGGHAGLLIGHRHEVTPDEALALSSVTIELTGTGQEPVQGQGRAVLGGPTQAIAALLAAPEAPSLPAAALVCTGALTGSAHPVSPGQTWRIDALTGPLSTVSVTFASASGVR